MRQLKIKWTRIPPTDHNKGIYGKYGLFIGMKSFKDLRLCSRFGTFEAVLPEKKGILNVKRILLMKKNASFQDRKICY